MRDVLTRGRLPRRDCRSCRRLRLVIGLQRGIVFRNAAVQRRHLQPLLGQDAGLAGIAVEERAVDRHQRAAQQIEAAGEQHKIPVCRLQPGRVVLAEIGNRAIARRQAAQQPHQLHIAPRFAFQSARRAHLVEIAVQIEPQEIGRIIRRLAGAAVGSDIAETQLVQIERIDIGVDGTNRIVPTDVILQTRRQETCLIAALTRLVGAVRRHTGNRTSACVADDGNSCPAS